MTDVVSEVEKCGFPDRKVPRKDCVSWNNDTAIIASLSIEATILCVFNLFIAVGYILYRIN